MSLSFQEPAGSLAAAVAWLDDAATGSLAVGVAIVAVAGVGLLQLTGRLALRRAVFLVLGCFLVFGARPLAQVLTTQGDHQANLERPNVYPAPLPSASPSTLIDDPYAGASLVQ